MYITTILPLLLSTALALPPPVAPSDPILPPSQCIKDPKVPAPLVRDCLSLLDKLPSDPASTLATNPANDPAQPAQPAIKTFTIPGELQKTSGTCALYLGPKGGRGPVTVPWEDVQTYVKRVVEECSYEDAAGNEVVGNMNWTVEGLEGRLEKDYAVN